MIDVFILLWLNLVLQKKNGEKIMIYNFENLDAKTRAIMQEELDNDLKSRKFYEDKMLKESRVKDYINLLRECFEKSDPNQLSQKLSRDFFVNIDSRGRQTRINANEFIAFGDFNRYYVRALLRIAIEEKSFLQIYRAKESTSKRSESESLIGHIYNEPSGLEDMLDVFRDTDYLFSNNYNINRSTVNPFDFSTKNFYLQTQTLSV